jgi:hypothetical protein
MGRMQNTALWTSMENFLARFEHEDESKELNRLVAELRMGGRLNGGDILNLREIIKVSRVAGAKMADRERRRDEIN